MSVTSHIHDRGSPVRAFFERELPDTRATVAEANNGLRGGLDEPPLSGLGNASLVATAADVLLNAWIDPSAEPAWPAVSPTLDGAEMLFRSQQAVREGLRDGHSPSRDEWRRLVPHGLLLATFVSVRRSAQAQVFARERLQGAAPDLDDYARRLWQPADEEDLATLIPAVADDHVFARAATRVAVNPTFALSARLGGADADLIVDGTLWDYKATRQRRVTRREEIWQLVAYLLADADDRFALHAVGLSALRWRTRHFWPATGLLAQLSGQPATSVDLAEWRARFEAILPARNERRRLRPVRRRTAP